MTALDDAKAHALAAAGLVCVVGPTASGKTELAIRIAEAIDGVVISADSVQIYRGFSIGSGAPTREELARAPHRLVATHAPEAPIDAAEWARLAEQEIAAIRAAGKVPVVCGGTFFWVRALVLGLGEALAADPAVRERHRLLVEAEGRSALHEVLRTIDPASAARLHPNDVVRVSRALEVHELSGRTMTEWHAEHGFRGHRHEATLVALRHEPEHLTERIEHRIVHWLANGWIEEVEGLIAAGHRDSRAMGSVGYAEVRDLLEGKLPREELVPAIVRATRIFARRQRTWLNSATVAWF